MDLDLDTLVTLRQIADYNTDAVWAITGIILIAVLGFWLQELLRRPRRRAD